jgi:serine/threonine-protein kinase ATR
LAFFAVKDMVSRPQTTQTIAEMLNITVRELLLLVQTHALPWLVLTKKKEVIQKIAEARQEKETWEPVMDPANLGPIVALLLVQDVSNIEDFAKSRFNDISSHFQSQSLAELVLSESPSVALELLKAAADSGDEQTMKVELCHVFMDRMEFAC